MNSKQCAQALRSAASALEHGRLSTAHKKVAKIYRDLNLANAEIVTLRELDTILAALRHWQDTPDNGDVWQIANAHGEPLNMEEIDNLAERINFAKALVLP